MIAVAWLVVPLSASADGGGHPPQTPAERVKATVRAASATWREARAVLYDADSRQARAMAEGAPESPSLSLYLEGIGGSFDREPNAQNTLQAVFPFNAPGQSGAARRYAKAAATSGDVDRATLGVHVAREAGRAWIERAAWMERVEVRRRKLARIDEALALHEARYQLGEVAGTEVAQLDLEHVRETSALIDAEAESARRVERLTELCGDGCAHPQLDDLRSLVDATHTPDADELTVEAVEAGGLSRQAKAASAAAVARSELISRIAYGRPSVALEWEHFPALDGLPSYDAWGFMIAVPLPVGRAGKQQKAAAAADALASRERIEGRRLELLRMAVDARNDAAAAAERLATVTTVLSELERIEQSLVLQFRLGAISYLAYIDGLSRLDDVRLDAISIREALLVARLELATIVADPSIFPMPTVDEEAS
jgi:outer membrane protein TolC